MTPFRHVVVVATAIAAALAAAYAVTATRTRPGLAPGAGGAAGTALAAALPIDPAVMVGRLDNGLRYYIRANRQPIDRAELRLVVNAGSILERDDERGMAHFVEHMAFNGTAHFPKQAITSFMQSIGMRYGPSVNATTGYEETIYSLTIPTDKPEVIAKALLILEDWAHAVTFDPIEIDKERGVIVEEWRQRRNAGARLQEAQFPVLLEGSAYANRLPIGTPEQVRAFSAAALREFYARWYRPDLMAIVAVGDFDAGQIESGIRQRFAPITAAGPPAPRPRTDVPDHPGTRVAVATDSEATGVGVSIYRLVAPRDQQTAGDYRRELLDRVTAGLLSARLSDAAQYPDAPLVAAAASRGRIARAIDATVVNAALKERTIEAGVTALFVELARVSRFGFTAEELDRQQTAMVRAFERAMTEAPSRPSGQLAAEYIRNFTIDEPFPGLEAEFALAREFVPSITLDEVNKTAAVWAADGNRVVLLNAPDKPGLEIPDADRVTKAIAMAAAASVQPYVPRPPAQPLLDTLPAPGAIDAAATRPEMAITEWTLSNGAHVVIKPTAFKEDEVLFRAFSPGGTSLASDEDFIAAQTSPQVVSSVGFGKLASGDIRRALAGKAASVAIVLTPIEAGLAGGGSVRDLETLFQLIHLHFRTPRRDEAIFGALVNQVRTNLANQAATPEYAFAAALADAVSQGHPRARVLPPDAVAQMSLDKSIRFYQDRFADAGRFTFVFVGSADPAVLRPLVERYLASLPALHRNETWRDVGIRPPAAAVERQVAKGREPKSRATMAFAGDFVPEPARIAGFVAMSEVLQTRLRDTVREELGGTYDVSVAANLAEAPRAEYRLDINFTSDPARLAALLARVRGEIEKLRTAGPSARELADVKSALLRDYETSSRQNGFVLTQLVQRYQTGQAPETLLHLPDLYRAISAAAVRDAARASLDLRRVVTVTLVPEK